MGKSDRTGDQFLEGRDERDGDSLKTKSRILPAVNGENNYIDGDQNDNADDEYHFFGEHKSDYFGVLTAASSGRTSLSGNNHLF